jgi:uncharacterized protein
MIRDSVCQSTKARLSLITKKQLNWGTQTHSLIWPYHLSGHGCDIDLVSAFTWFKRAADQGHVESIFNMLGQCYDFGLGVAIDKSAAFKYYKRAADAGNVNAQCNLGICYFNGTGVKLIRWKV